MKLSALPKFTAYSKSTKRRGKGVGSGQGKTAGRGHKGGKARAGYSPAPCCSGIPFYRHLPIRGFSNFKFRARYEIVSLDELVALGASTVDKAVMFQAGLIKTSDAIVKVLGGCPVSKTLTIIADKFSKSATNSVVHAGGQCVSLSELQ